MYVLNPYHICMYIFGPNIALQYRALMLPHRSTRLLGASMSSVMAKPPPAAATGKQCSFGWNRSEHHSAPRDMWHTMVGKGP